MNTEEEAVAAAIKTARQVFEAGYRHGLRVSADTARAVVYPMQPYAGVGYVKPYVGYTATPWGLFEPSQGTFKAT